MAPKSVDPRQLRNVNGTWVVPFAGPAMLAIVSDSCGHCHALKRTLDTMKDAPTAYFLPADNADAETQNLLRSLDITGVPEIFWVDENGQLVRHNGSRDEETLRNQFSGSRSARPHTWEKCVLPFVALVIIIIFLLMR